MVVPAGAKRRAKARHIITIKKLNTVQLFTGRMPFLSPNEPCRSTEGKLLMM